MSRPPTSMASAPPNTDGPAIYAVLFKTYEPLLGARTRETDFHVFPDRYGLTYVHNTLSAANAAARQIALFGTPENDFTPTEDDIYDGEAKTGALRADRDYTLRREIRHGSASRENSVEPARPSRVEDEEMRVRYVKIDWDRDGCIWYDVEFEAVREINDSYATSGLAERITRRFRRDPLRKVVAYVKKMHVTDDAKKPLRNVVKQNMYRFMPRDWRGEFGATTPVREYDIKAERGDESPASDVFNKLVRKVTGKDGPTNMMPPPTKTSQVTVQTRGTQTIKSISIAPVAPKKREYASIAVQVEVERIEDTAPASSPVKAIGYTQLSPAPTAQMSPPVATRLLPTQSSPPIASAPTTVHSSQPTEAHHGRKTTLEEYIRTKSLAKAKNVAAPEGTLSAQAPPAPNIRTPVTVPVPQASAPQNRSRSRSDPRLSDPRLSDPRLTQDVAIAPRIPIQGSPDASALNGASNSPRLLPSPLTPTLASRVPPVAQAERDGPSPKRRKPTYAMSALVPGNAAGASTPHLNALANVAAKASPTALEPHAILQPPPNLMAGNAHTGFSRHTPTPPPLGPQTPVSALGVPYFRHISTPPPVLYPMGPPADPLTQTRSLTFQLDTLNSFLHTLHPILTSSTQMLNSQEDTTRNREALVAHLQNTLKQKEAQLTESKEWLENGKKELEAERQKIEEERKALKEKEETLGGREEKLENLLKGLMGV
ncbi:hypothetical protein BJ508DRAFT_331564 [Ascobolus immersus RN42]|uniref:Uncharacterized protein n=1 Tax=Ascobolus immersus RN42 TaxID=1160509 RepID=A0A3N4HSK2_ASCIM|nr:hypothetical protein BJ508DRAFT_331564 [Ascobolus immersus RN42]